MKIKLENVHEHQREPIHLDSYNQFYVPSLAKSFPSILMAQEAIERNHKDEGAVQKQNFKPLPIIDADGVRHVITSIHAGTGRRVIKPELEKSGYSEPATYPDLPNIEAKIRERNDLVKRANEIYSWLKNVELCALSKGYGYAVDLPRLYKRLAEDYSEKKAIAEKEMASGNQQSN